MNPKALAAEFIGTFTLVIAWCGAALFSAPAGDGTLVAALAVGLAVLAMSYAVGHISGGHFNPAVTVGLVAGGRFTTTESVPYIIAQVLGGLAAALLFSVILGGAPSGSKLKTFMAISNNFGGTGQFTVASAVIVEVVLTALFLIVVMGATSKRAPAGFAPIAIGLALTVFYLVSIPISNASLNPARSTATALLAGGSALANLWVFWLAPIIGGAIGGGAARWLQDE